MTLPSNFMPGSSIGTLPVAMMMFFASISCAVAFRRLDGDFARAR